MAGEYRGMKLSLYFDMMSKTNKACLEGQKHHYCDINPSTDVGNIIRLDNLINNIEKDIQQNNDKIAALKSDLEQMKVDVEIPFPKADELFKAETRLEEVHEELTKFELSDDTAHKEMYERLMESYPQVMSGEMEHQEFNAGASFDKLTVEKQDDIFYIGHSYEQNGDLMYDPLITLRVDVQNEKVIPLSHENSGMGVYESYDETVPHQRPNRLNRSMTFLVLWMIGWIILENRDTSLSARKLMGLK